MYVRIKQAFYLYTIGEVDKRVEEFKSVHHSLFTLGPPWQNDRVTLRWAIASLSHFLQGNNQIEI